MNKRLTLLSVILFLGLVVTSQTYAQNQEPDPIVIIYDEEFHARTTFNLGEELRIYVISDATPYDVVVTDPDGEVCAEWNSINSLNWWSPPQKDLTNKLGWWEVKAGSTVIPYGAATYHVIPGTPLGVAAVLTACFASLGTKRILHRRK